jgi:hypothetical protein
MTSFFNRHFLACVVSGAVLTYVLAFHINFIHAVTDPVFQPDSPSYFTPALDLLEYHQFTLSPYRTPGYSAFLALVLALGKNFLSVLIVQHTLCLLTALMAALLYWKFFTPSLVEASVVFLFSSCLPQEVIAAHSILTETLYAFMLMGALSLFFITLRRKNSGWWTCVGLAASFSLLVRPVGWAVMVAVAALAEWRKSIIVFLAVSGLVLGSWSLSNKVHHGFFGIDQFSGLSLFGSSAAFLDPKKVEDPLVQTTLIPLYASYPREKFNDVEWVRYGADGPAKKLAQVYVNPNDLNRVLFQLSFKAISTHPLAFLQAQAKWFFDFFLNRSAVPAIELNSEYTFFLHRGLLLYEEACLSNPDRLTRIRHAPVLSRVRLQDLQHIMRLPQDQVALELEALDKADVYRYSSVLRLWQPLMPVIAGLRWLPLLACVASLLTWVGRIHRREIGVLWTFIVLHIVLTNLGGDADSRHAVPLEPLYWILTMGGLHQLIQHLYGSFGKSLRN